MMSDTDIVVILKFIVSSIIMSMMIYLLKFYVAVTGPVSIIVIDTILGIFIYTIGLFALSTFTKKELSFFKQIVWKIQG